jgi:hypothetical protein
MIAESKANLPTPESRSKNDVCWRRAFYAFFAFFILANIAWIVGLRILPFIDLPFHLATATVYRYIGQPGNRFADFYTIPTIFRSNVFHMLFAGCPIFPSVEFANKIFYVLYVSTFPVFTLLLIRRMGGNIWFSLLSFVILYHFSVHWGYVNYTVGSSLTLLLLLELMRYTENPSWVDGLGVMFLLVLIYFSHFQVALFAGLIALVSLIWAFRKSSGRLAVALLTLLPMALSMYHQAAGVDPAIRAKSSLFLHKYYCEGYYALHFPERLKHLYLTDFYYVFAGKNGARMARTFFAMIVMPLPVYILCSLFMRRGKEVWTAVRRLNPVVVILAVISVLCFLILPKDLDQGQRVVYQRFMVFVILSVILISSICIQPRKPALASKFLCGYLVLAALIHLGIFSDYFWDFTRSIRMFDPSLFPEGGTGKVLAPLDREICFKGSPVDMHFYMYYLVWKHGISSGLVDYEFDVVCRKPGVGVDILPPYGDLVGLPAGDRSNMDYIPKEWLDAKKYLNVAYLLAHDSRPMDVNGFTKIVDRPPWALYERDLLVNAATMR